MIYSNKVQEYVESGQYDKEVYLLTIKAKAIINYEVLTNPRPKTVIIDIDETILSNLPYIKEQEDLNDVNKLCEWQHNGLCQPIKPMVNFYNWLRTKPINIIFITARPLDLQSATMENFTKHGIEVPRIIFRDALQWPVPKLFKTHERRLICQAGNDIILNIGDQPTDFEGGHWKQALKVPNPFYIESKLPWQNTA